MIITRKIELNVFESDKDLRNEFYKTIRDWQYISRKYANDTMNILQSVSFIEGMEKRFNEDNAAALNDFLEGSRKNLGYKLLASDYKDKLPSTFRSSINQQVFADFKNNFKDVLIGKRAVNSYRDNFPLYFGKKSIIGLNKLEKDYTFKFFSIPMKTYLGIDKSNNEAILDKIVSGEYKMCDSSLQFKDKKLFLNLCVNIPDNKNKLDDKKVVGVDLGINVPAYVAVNFSKKIKKAIGSREGFLNERVKLQMQKRSLQKQMSSVKGGRGRNKKLKKVDALKKRESNFAKTYNHYISKEIVQFALKNKCGVIHIEDLSGIGKQESNGFVLRNWSYHQLQSFIEYKAKREGIKVVKVNPKYTSQRCNNCGHIEKENRETQNKFSCKSCGHEENADYNAARNISMWQYDEKKDGKVLQTKEKELVLQ
jgi:putative transposase